ncbi:golgin candidate 3-like isoform X7 [Durio zibethinus]|uniref:Golgin candidate 3-like isoform X7 n=1 Tax=Durio zibethinus TaxID=66656 RepID=A0A6P5ZXH9_DURZI|nr:golgin candidate 3-like isoform X7 [Durio zibethinus]
MWSSIANLKENLNKIALDVHDGDDEELEIYGSGNGDDSTFFERRNSHSFAHSKPVSLSPVANGIDSPVNSEIERYREEIKKLQDSEAEIKALSVNYAALLKEKEELISRLNQENGSLKQNLNVTNAALSAARSESSKLSRNGINALKGNGDMSPNRQYKPTSLVKNRNAGNQMSNGLTYRHDGKEKELADLLEEKNKSLEAVQASHELQIKQLKMELEKERDKLANLQIRLQGIVVHLEDPIMILAISPIVKQRKNNLFFSFFFLYFKFPEEHKLNESFQEELKLLKSDKDKSFTELSKMRNELNEKIIEIRRLQMELNRRENESADDKHDNLKRVIATLEKENTHLKMEKNELEAALESTRRSLTSKIDPNASETLDADEHAELSKREKEEILVKLSQTEKMLAERKTRINKLEEDNGKLRRALEQSMTRLNRMSMDSDYLVDRRIVIKLLVTYFQRNHSKEVLDLMVRMLGFSDEDKQRIGVAQHGAGKGVVRGVLGLPGRLVGGIWGGSSADVHANMASDNQSIADLWVDFLLKETEEREKRELAEDASSSREDLHGRSPNAAGPSSSVSDQTTAASGFSPIQSSIPLPSQRNFRQFEHSDSEFSTVPLTSSESGGGLSRLLPKY